MSENSRTGRTIAKKACDGCRVRKTQCLFDPNASTACRRCLSAEIPCTFLKQRKPRGPASRHVAELRRQVAWGQDQKDHVLSPLSENSPVGSESPGLPIGPLRVQYLVPEPVFLEMINDFLERVYPVLPLIHIPSFKAALDERQYETQPWFFRLCISLCAMSVASIPNKIKVYACDTYRSVSEIVEKACHMVLLSRLATDPSWQDQASLSSMVVSVILAMASHYAKRNNAGWAFASEAVHFFRALELYKIEGHRNLNAVDSEICKRAFWLLYIIQIHDRLSFVIPHTGLSYDPLHTDWDFLVPLEVSDDRLCAETVSAELPLAVHQPGLGPRPVISGFIGVVKIFLCVADHLAIAFPGPPPPYNLSSGNLAPQNAAGAPSGFDQHNIPKVDALFSVMKKLDATIRELPDELQLPARSLEDRKEVTAANLQEDALRLRQFEIMRANIYVTSLYIQSTMLEVCLNTLGTSVGDGHSLSASSPDFDSSSPLTDSLNKAQGGSPASNTMSFTARTKLWEIRKSLAQELLALLESCSPDTLESNGNSMVTKIREIAVTLLAEDEARFNSSGEFDQENKQYLDHFVNILARLDHIPAPLALLPKS